MVQTIITTVGTSLVTNFLKDYKNYLKKYVPDIGSSVDKIADLHLEDEQKYKNEIKKIQKYLNVWITGIQCDHWNDKDTRSCQKVTEEGFVNPYASAEIASTIKYTQKIKEDVVVYLLATDTLLGHVIAETIRDTLDGYQVDGRYNVAVHYNSGQHYIRGLQVKDAGQFKNHGIRNLVRRYQAIKDSVYPKPVVNVTGGYKGLIPILAVMGQVYGCTEFYMFENTGVIIEMNPLPLTQDETVFEKNLPFFMKLEEGEELVTETEARQMDAAVTDLLDFEDGYATLSPLGEIFWNKYNESHVFYYMSDKLWKKAQGSTYNEMMRFLASKKDPADLNAKPEEAHKLVFKRGANTERVYAFNVGNKYYLYRIFGTGEHDKHERFIMTPFTEEMKEHVIEESSIRALMLNNEWRK